MSSSKSSPKPPLHAALEWAREKEYVCSISGSPTIQVALPMVGMPRCPILTFFGAAPELDLDGFSAQAAAALSTTDYALALVPTIGEVISLKLPGATPAAPRETLIMIRVSADAPLPLASYTLPGLPAFPAALPGDALLLAVLLGCYAHEPTAANLARCATPFFAGDSSQLRDRLHAAHECAMRAGARAEGEHARAEAAEERARTGHAAAEVATVEAAAAHVRADAARAETAAARAETEAARAAESVARRAAVETTSALARATAEIGALRAASARNRAETDTLRAHVDAALTRAKSMEREMQAALAAARAGAGRDKKDAAAARAAATAACADADAAREQAGAAEGARKGAQARALAFRACLMTSRWLRLATGALGMERARAWRAAACAVRTLRAAFHAAAVRDVRKEAMDCALETLIEDSAGAFEEVVGTLAPPADAGTSPRAASMDTLPDADSPSSSRSGSAGGHRRKKRRARHGRGPARAAAAGEAATPYFEVARALLELLICTMQSYQERQDAWAQDTTCAQLVLSQLAKFCPLMRVVAAQTAALKSEFEATPTPGYALLLHYTLSMLRSAAGGDALAMQLPLEEAAAPYNPSTYIHGVLQTIPILRGGEVRGEEARVEEDGAQLPARAQRIYFSVLTEGESPGGRHSAATSTQLHHAAARMLLNSTAAIFQMPLEALNAEMQLYMGKLQDTVAAVAPGLLSEARTRRVEIARGARSGGGVPPSFETLLREIANATESIAVHRVHRPARAPGGPPARGPLHRIGRLPVPAYASSPKELWFASIAASSSTARTCPRCAIPMMLRPGASGRTKDCGVCARVLCGASYICNLCTMVACTGCNLALRPECDCGAAMVRYEFLDTREINSCLSPRCSRCSERTEHHAQPIRCSAGHLFRGVVGSTGAPPARVPCAGSPGCAAEAIAECDCTSPRRLCAQCLRITLATRITSARYLCTAACCRHFVLCEPCAVDSHGSAELD